MKYLINPYLRSFLILGAWFLCVRKIYIEFDHSYFFDELAPTLLIILASIISLISFFVDYARFKVIRKPVYFIPTFISVLGIASLIVIFVKLKQQDKTPIILSAHKGAISIYFRENGTYKCTESSGFMGDSYSIRGKYKIKDSIIQLDKSNLFDQINTDKLLMRAVPKNMEDKKDLLTWLFPSKKDTLPETYLFQLDSKGNTKKSSIALRVTGNLVGYPGLMSN